MKTISPARRIASTLLLAFGLLTVPAMVQAQTSAITYQGRFSDTTASSQPTNGTYSMTFRLYDALTGGNQIGSAISGSVTVTNGIFSTSLDFGATAFNTTGARYLEVQIGATVLTPRQQVTSTPFAGKATNAGAADALSSACVGCVTDSQINTVSGVKVTGTVSSASFATTATTATDAQQLGGVAASGYLQTGGSGANVTNLNASNLASGTVPDARLSTDVTLQGNSVNGANQLVKLDGDGKLPAIDGSQLTNLPAGSVVTPFVDTFIPPISRSYSLSSFGTAATRVFLFSFGGASTGSSIVITLSLPPASAYPAGTRIQVAVIDNITSVPTVQYQRTSTTTDTLHGFNQGAGSGGPGFSGAFSTWITDGSSNWYRIAS